VNKEDWIRELRPDPGRADSRPDPSRHEMGEAPATAPRSIQQLLVSSGGPSKEPIRLAPVKESTSRAAETPRTREPRFEEGSPSPSIRPDAVDRAPHPDRAVNGRVAVRGKFFRVGDEKFTVRGVTYGPFRPDAGGSEYGDRDRVERDFARMAASGINAVRVYTVPPRWLLDAAGEHGLRVMVGVPWEQHVAFLDDRRIKRRIVDAVRKGVRACAGHPAVLCFAIGNEIPASIARWHGRRPIERFIRRLYRVAKAEDPTSLVTYVNYPSTEYLRLPFLDFMCFNVYLEEKERLEAYLARLQNLAGEQPLIMTEIGLDSLRNGEAKQAATLQWQVESSLRAGCAGAFVFSWTDSWFRGGQEIEDWAFGLTDRDRRPKPALAAVSRAFEGGLLPGGAPSPFISVVVCTYNGSRTIRECLEGVTRQNYDDYEVIVIDDGSRDETAAIIDEYVRGFEVRHIRIENGGLSNARNVGMKAARGEIVAYIDDDAYPDPDWLTYLAIGFTTTSNVGIGGPNLPPVEAGTVADCVANSPGGPSHVLHTDLEAEHLPGCNMAFRKSAIEAIDGFDTRFRIAGDDVDLCWRLLENGGTMGFHGGALVWHHRRGSVQGYLKQQFNYGKAEAMLEAKWPGKYNRLGHLRWAGRLYGRGHTQAMTPLKKRVLHGVWGTRLFQPMYSGASGPFSSLTLMPEWYLVTAALGAFSLMGFLWTPLFLALPLFVLAAGVPLVQVCLSARRARFSNRASGPFGRWKLYGLTALLHALQPLARLLGRVRNDLTPWRRHGDPGWSVPRPRVLSHWSEVWRSPVEWLERLERRLQARRVLVSRGGERDRWDLQATCGLLGSSRLISTLEEHGQGKQMIRVRVWPRMTGFARLVLPLFVGLSVMAALDRAWIACAGLAAISLFLLTETTRECCRALNSVRLQVGDWGKDDDQ